MTAPRTVESTPELETDPHLALYATARAALICLAETVPWDSLLDYDVALELFDGLHGDLDKPSVHALLGVSKRSLYDAVRSGIDALTRYGLDAKALGVCRGMLDATWAADPHHTTLVAGGGR